MIERGTTRSAVHLISIPAWLAGPSSWSVAALCLHKKQLPRLMLSKATPCGDDSRPYIPDRANFRQTYGCMWKERVRERERWWGYCRRPLLSLVEGFYEDASWLRRLILFGFEVERFVGWLIERERNFFFSNTNPLGMLQVFLSEMVHVDSFHKSKWKTAISSQLCYILFKEYKLFAFNPYKIPWLCRGI